MTGAIVLAAGPGSRLGDLGRRIPKTMIPVAGRPYLESLAGLLLAAGMRPVVVAVHHHADMIRNHFRGHPLAPDLIFIHTRQRGTGSDLVECLEDLPVSDFVVWNGDTMADLEVSDLLDFAGQVAGKAAIVLTRRLDVPNQDAWFVAADGTVLATLEAVPPSSVPPLYSWRGSSTGVLFLRKAILAEYKEYPIPDLYGTILPALIRRRLLRAYDNGNRYFLDFGTPRNLARIDHNLVASWHK